MSQQPLTGNTRYKPIRDLNSGTFGFVQLALDTQTGQEVRPACWSSIAAPAQMLSRWTRLQVAIKFIERGSAVSKSVLREILNHCLCIMHPHIVQACLPLLPLKRSCDGQAQPECLQFREVCLTRTHLCIVMEYASGGDLFEYVLQNKAPVHGEGIPEASARWFFKQLMVAVEFCHELGIANRCCAPLLPAAAAAAAIQLQTARPAACLQGREAGEHAARHGGAPAQREAVRLRLLQERVHRLAAQDGVRHARLHCSRGASGSAVVRLRHAGSLNLTLGVLAGAFARPVQRQDGRHLVLRGRALRHAHRCSVCCCKHLLGAVGKIYSSCSSSTTAGLLRGSLQTGQAICVLQPKHAWWCTGVLPFAKRGDNRSNNLIRLQQMFPRIVAADFHNPGHVSPQCQALLKRMLTADPNQRITIAEVLQHPWILADSSPCVQVRRAAGKLLLVSMHAGALCELLKTPFTQLWCRLL